MDLNMILAWSVAAMVVAGLTIYFRVRKKTRNRKTLEPLLSFARDNNSEISFFDMWDKTLIGIDNAEIHRLFFMRNIPGYNIREIINLWEVSECKMIKTERSVRYNRETISVIDRIELGFSFYTSKPPLFLEFYNTDYDHLSLASELLLAQKWSGLIKSIINEGNDRNAKKRHKSPVENPQRRMSVIANERKKRIKDEAYY